MSTAQTKMGLIEVSPIAIASAATQAATSTYGVVGIAPKNLASELLHMFRCDARHAVGVRIKEDGIVIDVHVVVEYGTRIASVAKSIMNLVKFEVERSVGVPVTAVNVHVERLRISSPD